MLAPWLYFLAERGASHRSGLYHLAPFHRFLDRSLLGLALIGLWPLLRYLGIRSWREVGFSRDGGGWRKAGLGFLIGFGSLALVAAVVIIGGAREVHISGDVGKQLLGAILTAAVVAILEEVLFRGGLFGALRKALQWPVALVISSAVYALVHFLKKGNSPAQVDWLSGLGLLPQMFRNFADLSYIVPAFFVLLLVGAILALAYQRTGSLYMSIGLHAGWIFWFRAYLALTKATVKSGSSFWGTDWLIDGWLAFLVLGAVFLVLWKWLPGKVRGEFVLTPALSSEERENRIQPNGQNGPLV